jgi:endonuclease/exonuclease/phosphatase family metal-dependent hydrolase
LTIYSRNIFGIPFKKLGRRFKGISRQIADINPDIVLLQEFTSGLFLLYFHQQLRNYNFFYQNNGLLSRGGLLTMVKKNIRTDNYGFTQFTNLGSKYNLHLFDNMITKGFQSLRLPQYGLCLINTHVLTVYAGRRGYSPLQLKQVMQIRRFLRRQTAACFLTGDFNFCPNTPPYHLLLKNTSLIDASLDLGNSAMIRKKYTKKIDYVFLDPSRLKIKSIVYLDDPKFLSDHRAIVTSLQIKRAASTTDFPNK